PCTPPLSPSSPLFPYTTLFRSEFLKGFSGYLTCDGFNGYNKLKDVIRCGCLAHMRRYWHDALPGKSKKSPDKTPAEIGFDYCNRSEEHTSELQSRFDLVCRLLL